MTLDRDQNGRLEEALDVAMDALRLALARRCPECIDNDESPDMDGFADVEMVARLRAALREYGERWLAHNLPAAPRPCVHFPQADDVCLVCNPHLSGRGFEGSG